MTIVRCPRCRDEVTVPPRAGPRALVRCPLCLEQYLLSEALANAPPPLVIIGGEVETAAISPGEDVKEYQVSLPSPVTTRGPGAAGVMLPRPVVHTRQRPRRKEQNGLVLLVNYVVGGVMGLGLGLLVLWWGFRRDPLELGPPVAQYAPWIVPAQFRSVSRESTADGVQAAERKSAPAKKMAEPGDVVHARMETAKSAEASREAGDAPDDQEINRAMPDLTDLLDAMPLGETQP